MSPLLLVLVVLPFVLASAAISADTVDLGYARYIGRRSAQFPSGIAFLGLPYAEPPLGNLRFRAPVALDATRVTASANGQAIPAIEDPAFCIQGATAFVPDDRGGAGSEDCLKVNVYAPLNATASSKLPVLVYIHSGGFIYGNPASWPFEHWIEQSPNIVVVSVYYRLGALGFLSHPALPIKDLNAGFQDQRMALRWVQKHITAFGGDPNQVTINGESAGGASVELHLVAKGLAPNERLFERAIAQSLYKVLTPLPVQQVSLFNAFAAGAGCAEVSTATKVQCLRNASISALAISHDAVAGNASTGPYNRFDPVMDGNFITAFPSQTIISRNSIAVPILSGMTVNETLAGGPTFEAALHASFPALTTSEINKLVALYPASEFPSLEAQTLAVTGEASVRCGALTLADTYTKRGIPAFAYRYNTPNPTTGSPLVQHAAEHYMMFRGTNVGVNGTYVLNALTPTEHDFSTQLLAYWISFVRSGNPNTFKLPQSLKWPQYSISDRKRVVLQEIGSVLELETKRETERCALIASLVHMES